MSIEIYRNLAYECYSLRDNGVVKLHPKRVIVENARLAVQPAGNRKVRETRQKNVHAFVRTDSMDNISAVNNWFLESIGEWREAIPIFYNPYKHTSFIDAQGRKVTSADRVLLDVDFRMYAINPKGS